MLRGRRSLSRLLSARSGDARGEREEVTRLEPIGKSLPEKRSDHVDLGDLKTGSIVQVLGAPASSGVAVNEGSALGVAAVSACVSLLSDMVAKLPLELFQQTENGPVQIRDNPGANLIAGIPSDLHTSFELRSQMMDGKGLGGNGYARVYRDVYGDPYSIQWLAPCDVEPKVLTRPNGERIAAYKVEGVEGLLSRQDVIHIHGRTWDGITGISPVTLLRESIGTALSQTQSAGSLMRNGTQFPGFLTTQSVLKKEIIDSARDEFNANYSGVQNSGRVPVLNGTFDFKQTNGMSMVDAQFIESRRFELQEIARHYRIPSFMIGDATASSSWGTGIQEQTLGFLNFSLDPHIINFEQALAHTLLTTAQLAAGYYFRFDRDELASVSRQDTAAYFNTMRNIGVYSVNDIRAKLDEPLISDEDGGNDYSQPLNSSATAQPAAKPKSSDE